MGVAPATKPASGEVLKTVVEQPLVIDLQLEKQTREYDGPDPKAKLFLVIDELYAFPEGTKIRGGVDTVSLGTASAHFRQARLAR
jgi:hypothetical protein